MAKRKSRRAQKPAPWFKRVGVEAAHSKVLRGELRPERAKDFIQRARKEKTRELREQVKRLRRYFQGFNAADGYDIRKPETLSAQRVNQIERYHRLLAMEGSTPFKRVRPKTRRQRKVLQQVTGQRTRRQKAYLVHVEAPEKTSVRFTKKDKLRITRRVKGGAIVQEMYLFEEMTGEQPVTFGQMTRALSRMLRYMPKGYYTLLSAPHGSIGVPTERDMLHRLLQEYEIRYEQRDPENHKGFAEILLGFQFQGNKGMADAEYAARLQQRMQVSKRRVQHYDSIALMTEKKAAKRRAMAEARKFKQMKRAHKKTMRKVKRGK